MADELELWTVYEHPTDYPDWYVARKFILDKPTKDVHMCRDLATLRKRLVARGLTCLARNEEDEPHIVETWL